MRNKRGCQQQTDCRLQVFFFGLRFYKGFASDRAIKDIKKGAEQTALAAEVVERSIFAIFSSKRSTGALKLKALP